MPVNGRVKGHTAERAVARFFRDQGWPMAITSRNAIGHDGQEQEADILGVPGVAVEVKNRAALNIGAALCQTEIQAGPGKLPLLVVKPYGVGLESVGRWWVMTYVDRIIPVLPREGEL